MLGTVIVLVVLFMVVLGAVRSLVRTHAKGGCAGCSGCSGSSTGSCTRCQSTADEIRKLGEHGGTR